MRIRLLIRILTVALITLPSMLGCSGNQNNEDCIVLETETFKLTLGKDAVARSLVVKGTNEEMLIKGANVPLFSATQDRPFNNETKLQHPNTRTTYKADSLVWDGERLTVGFETATGFATSFKKMTGLSPSEYRKQMAFHCLRDPSGIKGLEI